MKDERSVLVQYRRRAAHGSRFRPRVPALLLAVLVPLAACARTSAPVSLGAALNRLQRQLADAGAVSAVGADPVRFAAAALAAQCAAGAADPEVPVLAHDITLDLSGSFTANGGFELSPTPEATFLSLGATRAQSQEISLPLSFVALSELPAEVAAQRLAPLASLPAADRAAETAPILAERDVLRARIDALVASWSPARCTGSPPPAPGPFHPNARRAGS